MRFVESFVEPDTAQASVSLFILLCDTCSTPYHRANYLQHRLLFYRVKP